MATLQHLPCPLFTSRNPRKSLSFTEGHYDSPPREDTDRTPRSARHGELRFAAGERHVACCLTPWSRAALWRREG
jgi:hypothetical protein